LSMFCHAINLTLSFRHLWIPHLLVFTGM
jgi:hypothetical protein